MALENVPASSASDGRWRITQLADGVNALSVAIIAAGKPITYSLTADGFNYTIAQATVEDKRLTLIQDLARPGRVTETLEIKYVASGETTSAAAIFTSGSVGQLNVRRGVDNADSASVGGKADVLSYQAGVQRPDAPTENGLDTISQTLYLTKPTVRGGVLVA